MKGSVLLELFSGSSLPPTGDWSECRGTELTDRVSFGTSNNVVNP